MKSSTYKKVDGKVVEIGNNISNLEKSPLDKLLAIYQDLFNRINNGSQVVNFTKSKEYKESLLDCLQNVMIKILEKNEYQDMENLKGYFKKCFYDRYIDNIRFESTYDIFRQDFSEYCQNPDFGISKQYLDEMILSIQKILSISQFKIFKLYHIKGYTMQTIADKLNTYKVDISRQVTNINNRIAGDKNILNFACIFDNRYVSHFSGKKKRQLKRKVLTHKEYIDLSSKPYNLDISDYNPPSDYIPESIPENKAMAYPTKQYYRVKKENFSYCNGNADKESYFFISNLVLGNAKIDKHIRTNEYIKDLKVNSD